MHADASTLSPHLSPLFDIDLDQVAELCQRIEAAAESPDVAAAADAGSGVTGQRRGKGRRSTSTPRDGLAYVTLTKAEWAELVNPLGAVGEPNLRDCRDAICVACRGEGKGDRGKGALGRNELVTLWHPVSGFAALLKEVLRTGRGCSPAAKVSDQVYRTGRM